jgi:DNA-binding transcriptional LysR family regulator
LGVVALPPYVCAMDFAAGRLSRLLADWTAELPEVSLIMHERRATRHRLTPSPHLFAANCRVS